MVIRIKGKSCNCWFNIRVVQNPKFEQYEDYMESYSICPKHHRESVIERLEQRRVKAQEEYEYELDAIKEVRQSLEADRDS